MQYIFPAGNITGFAVLYTMGNCVSLAGSSFLLGPKRQFRNMTRARRRVATGIYFSMMLLTLALAFAGADSLLILICVFCQWCALVWYIASYIPFGQKLIKKFFSKVTDF